MKWNTRCRIVSAVMASIGVWLMQMTISSSNYICSLLVGLAASLCIVSAMLAFHMGIILCSESHTLPSLLRSYFRNQYDRLRRPFVKSGMVRMLKHPIEAQEKLLRQLTTRDAQTEYGRRHHLKDIKTLADLQKKHPLTTYDHYKEYIQRLADGEQGVFLGDDISGFGITSGTTGAGKLIPQVVTRPHVVPRIMSVAKFTTFETLGPPSPLQRSVILFIRPGSTMTKSGHVVSPVSLVSSKEVEIFDMSSAPPSVFLIPSVHEALHVYVHLLFGIRDKNLAVFLTPFASLLFKAMKILENDWESMLADIERGCLREDLPISDEIRQSLNAALTPDPARAEELRAEFSRGMVGIVSRVWPNLKFINSIDIGGFQAKVHQYYAKGTPIFPSVFKSTEACIGSNLWPDDQSAKYVLNLQENIFEFIPEDRCQDDNPDALLLDAVEKGQNYELVLTTTGGLYRYRSGDVVEVVNFHYNCPVIRVKYRLGELLNLRGEKTSAVLIQETLDEILRELGLPETALVGWTTAESQLVTVQDGYLYYFVFLELGDVHPAGDTAVLSSKFDDILRKKHHMYNSWRGNGTLAMAHVHQVRSGSFQMLKEAILATTSASANQFKPPRKLRRRELLELMTSCNLNKDNYVTLF